MLPDTDLFDGHLSPGEVLRLFLEDRGWSQELLADITGRSRQTIVAILGGKAGITPETAVAFGTAFGNSPTDWMRLESAYRLSRVAPATDVERRARIFGLLPIREMQRRGWIGEHGNLDDLEADVLQFLDVPSLDEASRFLVATRRANPEDELTPTQRAWCARARQMASRLMVQAYDRSKRKAVERELRELAAYPKEARHLSKVFSRYGVRFVVVEPLPGAKIDGAAFWLTDEAPVIAVSLRFDRVDAFWFTVMHEWSHVANNDALSVDTDVYQMQGGPTAANDIEARANAEAAATLIAPDDLVSFIQRVGPYYSRNRVVQFAHTIKMHPGIIVGQLQHRGEIGYSALRDFLIKVRDVVTETAVTDGWGKIITPTMLT